MWSSLAPGSDQRFQRGPQAEVQNDQGQKNLMSNLVHYVLNRPNKQKLLDELQNNNNEEYKPPNEGAKEIVQEQGKKRHANFVNMWALHGWTEEFCLEMDQLAQEVRSYFATRRERERYDNMWAAAVAAKRPTDIDGAFPARSKTRLNDTRRLNNDTDSNAKDRATREQRPHRTRRSGWSPDWNRTARAVRDRSRLHAVTRSVLRRR